MKALIAATFAAALALGACGDDDDTATKAGSTETSGSTVADQMGGTTTTPPDAANAGAGAGDGAIAIKNFKFEPETLKAKVGDQIKVTNEDSATHTLTAKDKSFDTGNLDEGADGTITVSKAGTFDYICNIHDYMKGTIEVE